ncbi:MAG: hypothetical protein FWF53_02990 [Candidatus Azobacteroides sp.]|nr:hypothetical protein [Candidatus Azobacteroides sp.]
MLLSFDTDDILFRILSESVELKSAVSGGIYTTDRPDNSEKEDITVNTITVTGDMPQSGTSNVNIHVPDLKTRINGQEQRKADRERLRQLTASVVSVLEAARVEGILFRIANQTTIREPEIAQHYTNLRIEWNICKINNN